MIKEFVKMLGVPLEAAEDALKSERMAKSVLTRRGVLLGTAALVAGTVFSFPTPINYVWMAIDGWVANPLAGPTKYNGGVALVRVNEKRVRGQGELNDAAFLSFRPLTEDESVFVLLSKGDHNLDKWVDKQGKLVSVLSLIKLN